MFDTSTSLGAAIDWAREGQRVRRDSIAALDDAEFDVPGA